MYHIKSQELVNFEEFIHTTPLTTGDLNDDEVKSTHEEDNLEDSQNHGEDHDPDVTSVVEIQESQDNSDEELLISDSDHHTSRCSSCCEKAEQRCLLACTVLVPSIIILGGIMLTVMIAANFNVVVPTELCCSALY